MRGHLKDLTIGMDGTQNITVSVLGDFREEFKKLKDEPVDVLIKKHRSLRSLDANAYAWVLIGKLAEAMQPPLSKEEVYQLMLKRYGQGGVVSIETERLPDVIRAIDYFTQAGTGKRGDQDGLSPSDADVRLAFELINGRYVENKIVVISSEWLLTQELLAVDEGTFSRVYERSKGYRVEIKREEGRNYRIDG